MPWPEERVERWSEFLAWADTVTSDNIPFATRFLFRGQGCGQWGLTTSLSRLLGKLSVQEALHVEHSTADHFLRKAHLHVDPSITAQLDIYPDWLALMQHHRAPTRLLDWSESPYVGAYFAVESCWNDDGAIWWFNPSHVLDRMTVLFGPDHETVELRLAHFNDPDAHLRIRMFEPRYQSD